jgi:uncharacterized protein
MVKPVGSRCNLDCSYCYYQDKDRLLSDTAGSMSDETLEQVIRQGIAGQDADTALFTWHGGEPTLLGLDFFRRVAELQQKYADGKQIENDLQTNGLLLDDDWCRLLKEHQFLVGLSIDGPKRLHNPFRTTKRGGPSFDQVFRAAKLLQQHDVTFNTLTVVNSLNARHPAEVYQFLTEELGVSRLQWLPCVEPKDFRTAAPGRWDTMPVMGTAAAKPGTADSVVTDWSVDPDDWGEFLCQTFDLWFRGGLGRVLVNWFESLVGQWIGQPPQICTLAEVCGGSLVIEKDGSVYCCDHYVYPEYRLGNVRDGLADMAYSARQRQFGCLKSNSLPNYCRQCPYCFACYGECPKNRFLKTPDGQPGLNYLCPGIKRFLTHADPYLRQIIARLHGSGVTQVTA